MNPKYYIIGFIYLSNVNGADLSKPNYLIHEYPTSYLRWIQHIRHMPEMNWLNTNLRARENIFSHQLSPYPIQLPNVHRYNNVQTMNRVPPNFENYCNQQACFPSYRTCFFYQKPVQFNISYLPATNRKH